MTKTRRLIALTKVVQRREHVSGLIPEHYKEITVRVYTRRPHLMARIQLGFRKVLKRINENVESAYVLEPESIQEHPDTESLMQMASQQDDIPIPDTSHNPFLESPQVKKIRSAPGSAYGSPSKKLLEINHGLSIPATTSTSFQRSLKKVRQASVEAKSAKKSRRSNS